MRTTISSRLALRIAKLEEACDRRRPEAHYRNATVVVDLLIVKGHLERIDHQKGPRWHSFTFKTVAGPGPQLEDFGHFDEIRYLTIDEWNA